MLSCSLFFFFFDDVDDLCEAIDNTSSETPPLDFQDSHTYRYPYTRDYGNIKLKYRFSYDQSS